MEQEMDTTLQQIAENALANSVVRLEFWTPTSYGNSVVSFDVKNPTHYLQAEATDSPADKIHIITKELMSHANRIYPTKTEEGIILS
ncbi:MAG: hypothetical protein OXI67_15430 [Candidatus Poribacteria bacterium]|nr:hypothetical protein [Candidatus Poribacteria bacterium]